MVSPRIRSIRGRAPIIRGTVVDPSKRGVTPRVRWLSGREKIIDVRPKRSGRRRNPRDLAALEREGQKPGGIDVLNSVNMDVLAVHCVRQCLSIGDKVVARPFLAAMEMVPHTYAASNAVVEFLLGLVRPLGLVPDPSAERDKVSGEGLASPLFIWAEAVWPRVREVVEAGKTLPSLTPPFVAQTAGEEEGLSTLHGALHSALGNAIRLRTMWGSDVVRDTHLA